MQRVLLLIHGVGWLAAVVIVVWRTGMVPPELWAVLPAGITAILVAFKVGADDREPRHRAERK